MDTIGQEFLLPALNPAEVWEESGRWAGMGDNMFRLKDRKGAELCLAMTHEEVMTTIARSELRSYKQLPQIWYQIQTKFRDEPRPKSGLLRVRQFLMKDAYSFDIDEAGLDASYAKHDAVYRRIFTRCGLEFVAVDADSGSMGGSQSQEFMVYTDAGEDLIASSLGLRRQPREGHQQAPCRRRPRPHQRRPRARPHPRPAHHRRGRRVPSSAPLFLFVIPQRSGGICCSAPPPDQDHGLHGRSSRLRRQADQDRRQDPRRRRLPARRPPAQRDQAHGHRRRRTPPHAARRDPRDLQSPAGYLGPIGLEAAPHPKKPGTLVILDAALEGRTNLIAGANKAEYHLRNVTPMRDFKPTLIADIRNINEGEPDPIAACPALGKAVEIGHIFKLGRKYTESMGASVLNRDGKETTPIMGSYGIGIERILTAAIESSAANSPRGGKPTPTPCRRSIAPFQVVVTITNVREPELLAAGEKIAATSKPPASTSCSTTATSAPASNSKTPT
jgi:prolyl-tRNA synthetase